MPKQYADASTYEAKLEKVMSRFSVEKYDYNWDRFSCWIEFWYKGQMYRFEHSIENAKAHGNEVRYGSDVFAQVVLTLEDIARMTERGIYELSTWVECFLLLGFSHIPTSEELKKRYKELAKVSHPDVGGNEEHFVQIKIAFEEAERALKEREQG